MEEAEEEEEEEEDEERTPREKGDKDKVVLKYLGQSNGGVVGDGRSGSSSGPGLREGHVKVECG